MEEPEIEYIETDTTCDICFAEFLDLEDLEIHQNQVHALGLFPCQFCGMKQRSDDDYAVHIRDNHVMEMKLCKFCTRVFNDENYCRRHEKKHTPGANFFKYSCSQCPSQFTSVIDLKNHEFETHKDEDITEGLWLQKYMPHLSSVLNVNVMNIFLSATRKLICTACGETSHILRDFIKHLQSKNCRSIACNSCFNVYKTRKGIHNHLVGGTECSNNMNMKNLMKRCSECYQDFPFHLWKAHQGHCKAIKCQKCQILFEKMDDLSKHQTEKHPLVISLQTCKYCKKEFVGTIALDKHIQRSHNIDLYKYNCVYCEMTFKHPQKMFTHFFTKHKEIEPFLCTICDKRFRIRKNFTVHIKLQHKGVGSVEFDENFHVYFAKKKLEKLKQDDAVDDCNKSVEPSINTETTSEPTEKEQEITSNSESKFVEVEIEKNPINSDFLATETDAQSENESKTVIIPKRKLKTVKVEKITSDGNKSDSSDDLSLLKVRNKLRQSVRKRGRPRNSRNLQNQTNNRFTCKFCNQSCYTFQNYHHHLNNEHQNEKTKCVKCSRMFESKNKLYDHISKEHSSSKLTETLKNLLAKRKSSMQPSITPEDNSMLTDTEKFQKTIKKVDCDVTEEPAILTSTSKGLSVQKFIESFTPESTDTKKNFFIDSVVSIKTVYGSQKPSFIKLTKFEPKVNVSKTKLAMPVRFKPDTSGPNNVTIKVVDASDTAPIFKVIEQYNNMEAYFDNDNYEHYEEMVTEDKPDNIPDVAQEVMLGNFEETPKAPIRKIIIPKIPEEIGQIHIATLLPEAPYYKILKINEVIKTPLQGKNNVENVELQDIKLPNGKKLVRVNPLAHLLTNTPLEKVMENTKVSKYYKPKTMDFQKAVAKALLNERPTRKRKRIRIEQ